MRLIDIVVRQNETININDSRSGKGRFNKTLVNRDLNVLNIFMDVAL